MERIVIDVTRMGDLKSIYIQQPSVWDEIQAELERAREKHGPEPFHSLHEGYAVLKEEVEELWDAIKTDAPIEHLRAEAVQVAAMAVRIIRELT